MPGPNHGNAPSAGRPTPLPRRVAVGSLGGLLAAGMLARPAWSQERVVVYSTTHPAIQAKLNAAFARKTGIAVQSLRLNSAALAQRFMAEQRAGQHVCDVVTLGNDAFFEDISRAGLLVDLSDRGSVRALKPDWRPSPFFVLVTAAPAGIAYNKRSVVGGAVPTGWRDLLRPEFKGQIILTDPRVNETMVAFVDILRTTYGDDFLRHLGRQDLRLVPVTQQGVEQLAGGEAKLCVPCNPGNLVRYHGQDAPVGLVGGVTPTYWTTFYSGITAQAPNRGNADQWLNFTLSEEGQQIICDGVSVSPLGDIPGALPTPDGAVRNPDARAAVARSSMLFDLLGLPA